MARKLEAFPALGYNRKRAMAKILIVEEDKFLRELAANKIREAGYEMVEAANGQQGVEKAQQEKPNLILLDIVLPELDGYEVLRQLKEQEATKEIPVVMLSNLGGKEDVEKALSLGAADYLVKAHVTPEEIVEKIGKVLR